MGDNITLIVGGENFKVEKEKLREASEYFRAMFSSQFREEGKDSIELKSVELEPFRTLLQWVQTDGNNGEMERVTAATTRDLMGILECSNMLQFSRVSSLCSEVLCTRINCEDSWQIFQLADLLSDRKLLTASHRFILRNFYQLSNHSHLPHLDKDNLIRVLSSQFLNVGSEINVLRALTKWIEANKPDESVVKALFESCLYRNELSDGEIRGVAVESFCDSIRLKSDARRRRLPIVPCVVGHLYGKNNSKSVSIFSWSEREGRVVLLCQIPSVQADQVVASGFKVVSEGENLVLSGGEFSLGYSYSNWNKNILSWDSWNKSWSGSRAISSVRRHHSAILRQGNLWMFGGFGKLRVVLNNMDSLDLETGEELSVSNLPEAMHKPAVALYKTSQIILVGKQMVALFDIDSNKWTKLDVSNYPTDLEFDRAMFDAESEAIYLTSSYSRTLFKCSILAGNSCIMESVGKFTTETKNTCLAERVIYNFNSEEFDDDRVLESYDIVSQQFRVIWKDTVPEWDFSPNYYAHYLKMESKEKVNILWFRNGLRLHDNESLKKATEDKTCKLLPLFIFDGETPTTKHCKYNKISFLLECLEDLDTQFWYHGGKLNLVEGNPKEVIKVLSKHFRIQSLCFDQDCEAIWLDRDNAIKNFCGTHRIEVEETIGQTLWDPLEIIEANGGTPPLTYSQFCHVTKAIGPPRQPLPDVDLSEVEWIELNEFPDILTSLTVFPSIPTPSMLGIEREGPEDKIYKGGERLALKYFHRRIKWERESFLNGSFLPNRREPDILNPPKSLSPDLKFGCISVKKFYWAVMDTWNEINENDPPGSYTIVSQLIWREFFYAMSANNPFYGEMEKNPICINVPWYNNEEQLQAFMSGKTGYPFIDAGVHQLKKEGWTHHIVRNALSMFLTRGDLWLSWEHGLKFFLNYMIDADWAVCAGNWMWVSSSAFEKSLNTSFSLDPSIYGCRVDPQGLYIKRYIPQLSKMPVEFIYEPWKAPMSVQREANCIIGVDYPSPIVSHKEASNRNRVMMEELQGTLMKKCNMEPPRHIKPSDEAEIKVFFGLNKNES